MKKKISIILISIVALLIVFLLAKNMIIKAGVRAGVKAVTGLKLDIDSMRIGVVTTLVDIKGLRLFNPDTFTDPVMVDLPAIYVDYDLFALLKKKIHLEQVKIDLKEFLVVKNKEGALNLDALKAVQAQGGKETTKEARPATRSPDIQIDVLELKIGKVVYKDYSRGGEPKIHTFDINIDERYENITNPNALARLIVVKALTNTTIGRLANFDIGPLADSISGTLRSGVSLATDAAKKTVDAAAEIGKGTIDTLKKTGEGIKNILPFGK